MSRNQLKYIAYVSMLLDHLGHVLFPEQTWLRLLGRFAAPLFFYFAAVSVSQTRNKTRYLLRLTIFALISEPFFNQMIGGKWSDFRGQNVYFTIFLGVAACCSIQVIRTEINKRAAGFGWLAILFAAPFAAVANQCRVDYKAYGVLMIVGFFCVKEFHLNEPIGNTVVLFLSVPISMAYHYVSYQNIVITEAVLIPPEKEDQRRMSRLWYAFYPVHIAVLVLVKQLFFQ